MRQQNKLDVLVRSGTISAQLRLTVRHVLDGLLRNCGQYLIDVEGTTRRGVVRSWRESLKYLLNEPADLVQLGRDAGDWASEAASIRGYVNNLLNGRRSTRTLKVEMAGALSDLADLVTSLDKVYSTVTGPWSVVLTALEARRESLCTPLGTAGRPDDDSNVHIVLKARDVRALLTTVEPDELAPPIDRVYTPFRRHGHFQEVEHATGYGYVTKAGELRGVVYDVPTNVENVKASARATGCDLYAVEVRLTDQIDTSPVKSREDVLREAALAALPPDIAEDLLKRAGLPPF